MPNQLPILDLIAEGERLKQQGIQNAEVGAGEQWVFKAKQIAFDFVKSLRNGQTFKIEDIRVHAYANDLIWKPKSERAWTCVKPALLNAGLIEHAGHTTVTNPKDHGGWENLWRKK
jgi:hypothetical protein